MWWESVITILGALGGFEFVKWLFNRKSAGRIATAEAEIAEFHTLKETIQFLQTQLKEKEERFAEQTNLVRKLNSEVVELTLTIGKKDLEHSKEIAALELELVTVRCDDKPCPFRQPPNAHTPPREGLTKEEYHKSKND